MSAIVFAAFLAALLSFLVGLDVGGKLTARKWRHNADDYRRIESNGELFKVFRGGEY